MKTRVVAVVLAGGTGQRLGSALPKQLIEIGGEPILARSIAAFDSCALVADIVVVMASGHVPAATRIAQPYVKVQAVVEGGASRTESTLAALRALADEADDTRVLFHDAARPFVDHDIIGRCVAALDTAEAAATAIPTSDTVVIVSQAGQDGHQAGHQGAGGKNAQEAPGMEVVARMPARQTMRRFQTPQGFRLGTIRAAYDRALADQAGFDVRRSATDDCGVVHRYLPEVAIRVVEGSECNLKITHPLDIVLAEQLAQQPTERPCAADPVIGHDSRSG